MLALATGNKIGLAAFAIAFIAFALASSFLFPRWRPNYPGRGLSAFIVISLALTVAMLGAVEVFAKEEEEPEHAAETGGGTPEPRGETTTQTETGVTTPARTIRVTETEYEIRLAEESLGQGAYVFEVVNEGEEPHNLVIEGPDVENEASPVIEGGDRTRLQVGLTEGEYKFYCSVPGHEEAGMSLQVDVS